MLLRFSAGNYLSLKDEVEISFLAAPLKEQVETLISSRYSKRGVLPVLAVYGANASGKSNLLSALGFMRSTVLNSFTKGDDRASMPHRPFLLNESARDACSTFVLDFVLNGCRYQYGFSSDKERVKSEWLYAYPHIVQQVLFSRNTDDEKEYYFGRALSGSNKQIQSITRPNSLFLSAAAKTGHPLLTEIHSYFRDNIALQLNASPAPDEWLADRINGDSSLISEVARYLSMADTGITDIKINTDPIPDSRKAAMAEFYQVLSKMVGESPSKELPEVEKSIQLGHIAEDGSTRYLDFQFESLGTQYLFTLLPPMLKALKNGSVLVLDEITTSLHTLLSRRLISVFKDKELNPHGAQLVFSTHDTNLLAPGMLRRDEIWFAEKAKGGATCVFPLTDIETKNTDNIERGYVQGRFGAIPFIGDWNRPI